MRATSAAIVCALVLTSATRPSEASEKDDAIARYEDWAEGRAPSQTAPDDIPPRDTPPATRTAWYGWQALLVDAGALLADEAGAQVHGAGGTLLGATGFLAYAALAPAVHGFHHRDGALVADLVLRAVLPIAAESAAFHTFAPWAVVQPYASGASAAGAGAAIALDSLLLAWDRRAPHDTAWSWSPRVALAPNGMTAGLAGTF